MIGFCTLTLNTTVGLVEVSVNPLVNAKHLPTLYVFWSASQKYCNGPLVEFMMRLSWLLLAGPLMSMKFPTCRPVPNGDQVAALIAVKVEVGNVAGCAPDIKPNDSIP